MKLLYPEKPMTSQIGVIIPTLNSAATLKWTLLSLLSQNKCDVQIIVVDSGSTDGTDDICREWGIKKVYAPPGNMYHAINIGMKMLNTKWLAYLNSDDLVYGDSYAEMIECGERANADLVYGHCNYIDLAGRYIYAQKAAPTYMLAGLFRAGIMGFAQPATIMRQKVFVELGGFNEEYRHISDFELFDRAYQAGYAFVQYAQAVAAFRVHAGQISSAHDQVSAEKQQLFTAKMAHNKCNGIFSQILWRVYNAPYYASRAYRKLKGDE
jgi:glycosyltransferase involved in cell wall biosynthesis